MVCSKISGLEGRREKIMEKQEAEGSDENAEGGKMEGGETETDRETERQRDRDGGLRYGQRLLLRRERER